MAYQIMPVYNVNKSVGKGGTNSPDDVRLVQTMLTEVAKAAPGWAPPIPLLVNGIPSENLDKTPAGAYSGTITIDDGKDEIKVEVRARVEAPVAPKPTAALPAPPVTVTPLALDFGSVDLNQTKALTFTATSPEAVACSILYTGGGATFFQIAPASFSLVPNQPTTVTVTFLPKVTLQVSGTVSGKASLTCGGSKASVDLKGATPVPKRHKLAVEGTGLTAEIVGKTTGDPQIVFNVAISCNYVGDDIGTCANTVQTGIKVEMKATCRSVGPASKFRWVAATGSASACQGSTNPVCTFVITADTTLKADCAK